MKNKNIKILNEIYGKGQENTRFTRSLYVNWNFYHYAIHPEIFETQDENFGGWSERQGDTRLRWQNWAMM